jgi:hypothetical protein
MKILAQPQQQIFFLLACRQRSILAAKIRDFLVGSVVWAGVDFPEVYTPLGI